MENQRLIGRREFLQLSMQIISNVVAGFKMRFKRCGRSSS